MRKTGTLKIVAGTDTDQIDTMAPRMDGYIAPEHLHLQLSRTRTKEITFKSESAMSSYRRMLYDVNKQGEYRYRTLRSEGSMWSIIIWRMK